MKKKKNTSNKVHTLSPESYIRNNSRNLPIFKCFINSNWNEIQLANIIIVRKHVTGNVTVCIYLVDLGCLGIKETGYKFNILFEEVEKLLKDFPEAVETTYELVHNIIFASIEYAEQFDFKPHKDFNSITRYFLEEDSDNIPLIEISCGDENGKPIYVHTGHETKARANQIVNQLEKVVGKGNFDFVLNLDDYEDEGFDYYNEYDEEDEDFDYDDEYDDEESEIDKDTDKIIKQLVLLSPEERKEKFYEYVALIKEVNFNENIIKLNILVSLIIIDITSKEEFAEQIDIFEEMFKNLKIVEEYELPNSLFTDVKTEDGNKLNDLFFEFLEFEGKRKKQKKVIKKVKKIVNNVPIIDLLETLQMKKCKTFFNNYDKKLAKSYKKYPNYFMFKALFFLNKMADKNGSLVHSILNEKELILTKYEASFYTLVCFFNMMLDENVKLSTLVAFEEFVLKFEDIKLSKQFLLFCKSLLLTKKISLIDDYFYNQDNR